MNKFRVSRDYYHIHREMGDWCEEQFGNGAWNIMDHKELLLNERAWSRTEMFGNYTYMFKNDDDSVMFLLRWGHTVNA